MTKRQVDTKKAFRSIFSFGRQFYNARTCKGINVHLVKVNGIVCQDGTGVIAILLTIVYSHQVLLRNFLI